jgi:hypothetical protein
MHSYSETLCGDFVQGGVNQRYAIETTRNIRGAKGRAFRPGDDRSLDAAGSAKHDNH